MEPTPSDKSPRVLTFVMPRQWERKGSLEWSVLEAPEVSPDTRLVGFVDIGTESHWTPLPYTRSGWTLHARAGPGRFELVIEGGTPPEGSREMRGWLIRFFLPS